MAVRLRRLNCSARPSELHIHTPQGTLTYSLGFLCCVFPCRWRFCDWTVREFNQTNYMSDNIIFVRILTRKGPKRPNTGLGKKTWRFLSYNKIKSILSFYLNLLLKLSLSQSSFVTIFTSWTQCLWGGVPYCQHIPASGGLLTKAWRNISKFSGFLSESFHPGGFLFAADAVSLQFLTHNSTVLRLETLVPQYWSAGEISAES